MTIAGTDGLVLVIQDTSEFSFSWAKRETIGAIGQVPIGRDRNGKPRVYTQCGLLMHGSLVVTRDGLPLGLAAVQFWSRKAFKGVNELKRHVNPTRVPIEEKESIRWLASLKQSSAVIGAPGRCVFVGDRENDIYEFFCAAREAGTHFLVRTCVDRLAGDPVSRRLEMPGQHRVLAEPLIRQEAIGCFGIRPVPTGQRKRRTCALLELLQQFLQPLAQPLVTEPTSGHLSVDPAPVRLVGLDLAVPAYRR